MKKKIIFSIILILTLLLIIMNFKVLATYNSPIEENNTAESTQTNSDNEYANGILDSKDQILENIQHLSEAKPRDPKGGLVMIIITVTVAIIIVLISWWYKTNF